MRFEPCGQHFELATRQFGIAKNFFNKCVYDHRLEFLSRAHVRTWQMEDHQSECGLLCRGSHEQTHTNSSIRPCPTDNWTYHKCRFACIHILFMSARVGSKKSHKRRRSCASTHDCRHIKESQISVVVLVKTFSIPSIPHQLFRFVCVPLLVGLHRFPTMLTMNLKRSE